MAARTTQRLGNNVTREKNVMEVIPFYCVANHKIGAKLVFTIPYSNGFTTKCYKLVSIIKMEQK